MRVPLLPCLALLCCLAGCDRGDPTVRAWGKAQTAPTPAEQTLLEQVTRDPFVQITGLERDGDGRLLVTTRQGSQTVRYLLAPVADGGQDLVIRRIAESLELVTSLEPGKGTGPEPRGLRR